jgi:hypothetical protein
MEVWFDPDRSINLQDKYGDSGASLQNDDLGIGGDSGLRFGIGGGCLLQDKYGDSGASLQNDDS